MTPTTLAAAIALSATGLATAAAAKPPVELPITAVFKPATQRYCIRPVTLEESTSTGVGIYQRRCMTARQWRLHGVRFDPVETAAAVARSAAQAQM